MNVVTKISGSTLATVVPPRVASPPPPPPAPTPVTFPHASQVINIDIINESTVVTDVQVRAAVAALQIQLDRDFAPSWFYSANLFFVPKGGAAAPGHWWLAILDNTDQAGALGYHDLTPAGLPLGKVFAKTDQQYHLNWTVTTSHELLEMMVDPYVNDVIFAQTTNTAGRIYAKEVCDAVEADSLGYSINGITVSDFVLPTWFDDWRTANSTKFSFMNHVHAPFQLASGGYIGYFDVKTGSGWKQITAQAMPGLTSRVETAHRIDRRANPLGFQTVSRIHS